MKTFNLTIAAIALAAVTSTAALAAGNGYDMVQRRADTTDGTNQAQDTYPTDQSYQAPSGTVQQTPDNYNQVAPHTVHQNQH